MQKQIIQLLQKAGVKLKDSEIENLIEIPPSTEMGDFAFPCFIVAKELKKNPNQIAEEFAKKIKSKDFEKIESKGPYINFFVNRIALAENLIKEIKKQGDKFGAGKKQNIKTMVEFVSPNTNKPLHVGHLRNMAIGESVSRISEFSGEKIIRASLNNDRGVHICKSMIAYKLFGKNKSPDIKPDHFVGKFYALFGKEEKTNPKIGDEPNKLLKKWEEGDKETITLWKKMNKWAYEGWAQTYKTFGIKFDKQYYESEIYTEGKEIILEGLKKGIFEKKSDGAIFINLEKENLGEKILLRSNGTSVYITQDIYLAKKKFSDFNLDKSYVVTGNEQKYHFEVLFSILRKLGFTPEGLKHLPYGMVRIPEGKIKSREGNEGLSTDEIIANLQKLTSQELEKRSKLSKKELNERSMKIALAAIKYSMLKIHINKDIIFDPKESVSFEGDTGPYLQYSYARASSILRKAGVQKTKMQILELDQKEIELIKKISEFPDAVLKAYESLNPSIIANYSYQLAQIFNEFYHACQVMNSKQTKFRLELVNAFRQVLKNSLSLLGIDVLEEM